MDTPSAFKTLVLAVPLPIGKGGKAIVMLKGFRKLHYDLQACQTLYLGT